MQQWRPHRMLNNGEQYIVGDVFETVGNFLLEQRFVFSGIPIIGDLAVLPFLYRPALLLFILGVVGGVVGVLVNLRALEFNAEAMVHSVFPGVVVGALFAGTSGILPAAALVAALVSIVLTIVQRVSEQSVSGARHTTEAGTAVVLTCFFSLGIVISLREGDASGQLEALMFGRLLDVTNAGLGQAVIVCGAALLCVMLTWSRHVAVAFDRESAKVGGVSTLMSDLILNAAIGAVVVAASSAVGVLLVIGFLVLPGATARLSTKTVAGMVPVAIAVGVIGSHIGLYIATLKFPHPVSPQAAVVLSMGIVCLVVVAIKAVMWRVHLR